MLNYTLNQYDYQQNVWKNIIQFLITVLTALGTAFGVTSCM
nr:smalltalk protein [uncultured Prevotella sp.]